ncbi:hypothetical protein EJ110_NYTH27550 [Nymphaea thermarum]|nr:hypothetical protein EJ110_NYTH27550 [Nymphaea thermarum]
MDSGDRNRVDVLRSVRTWKSEIPRMPFSRSRSGIICDVSQKRYDVCFVSGPTKMDPASRSLLLLQDPSNSSPPLTRKLRPLPRKWEAEVMLNVTEVTVSSAINATTCDFYHDGAALVFSTGGYMGNLYHDFDDGMIPLFITSRFIAGDFVLVISEYHNWWVRKYYQVLRRYSPHRIINLDNETSTHCFRRGAAVGLISHDDMTVEPSLMPDSEDMLSFREFLGEAFFDKYYHLHRRPMERELRPVMVMVVRNGSRNVQNQADVVGLAERVGFAVRTFTPTKVTDLNEAFRTINASHAMMGVHGAGLTHSLFLRPGSVLLQVIPLGADWVSETCFGRPARAMGLKYLPYRIGVEESSLVEKYGRNDVVLRDPKTVVRKNWENTKSIYLEAQSVKLDLGRLRQYLVVAYRHAKRFMEEADMANH